MRRTEPTSTAAKSAATTAMVCLLTWRLGTRFYPAAVAVGSIVHIAYNLLVMRMML